MFRKVLIGAGATAWGSGCFGTIHSPLDYSDKLRHEISLFGCGMATATGATIVADSLPPASGSVAMICCGIGFIPISIASANMTARMKKSVSNWYASRPGTSKSEANPTEHHKQLSL